jgi:hypothetical protein
MTRCLQQSKFMTAAEGPTWRTTVAPTSYGIANNMLLLQFYLPLQSSTSSQWTPSRA